MIFREPAIMVGRLITKVMRTSLPKSLGGLPISGGKNILLTSPLFCVTNTNLPNSLYTSPYFATRILTSKSDVYGQTTFGTPSSFIPIISMSTEVLNMGSILEHHKYREMKSKLSKMRRKGFNLGPLDTASLYILSSKELTVNLEILSLDALSPQSHHSSAYKGYAEIQEMKHRGSVKKGKLNKEDEAAIEKRFETLLAQTGLDKEALMEELFAANKGSDFNWDEDFMLKRQLAGFWLLSGMKDGDRRLPMEVYTKLAVLLYSGSFTEEEDAAILAWVDKHGPTRWAELARNLGRRYLSAGPIVQNRYEELTGKAKGNRQGAFDPEELTVLIREVMKQDPSAFEKPMEGNNALFKTIAPHMKRPRSALNNVYGRLVHPTVRRHKLGTLEKDVGGELIKQVKENNWKLSADIEFDRLACLPQFEGHNNISLRDRYHGMILNARSKLEKSISRREVTVNQVEKWWNASTRRPKRVDQLEKEQSILEAYYAVEQELRIGSRTL